MNQDHQKRSTQSPHSQRLLEVRNLDVTFETKRGNVEAVNGLDLTIDRGEILCIVGESGSGKSVTAQSIIDLVPQPPGRVSGSIEFKGKNLLEATRREIRAIRGDEIGFIFQDPLTSLNPVHRVGTQITEAVLSHKDWSKDQARERAIELMDRVGIPEARERYSDYPFEFSGGMRQRIMIAIALANEPDLLIADEPTTALDVTIEAQVIELVKELREEFDMSVIWITHDFGVVAEIADFVTVMYAGNIVERADVFKLFRNPKHPYTKGLLNSIPGAVIERGGKLEAVEGEPPDLRHLRDSCHFIDRCPEAMDRCADAVPPAYEIEKKPNLHEVRCYLYDNNSSIDRNQTGTTEIGEDGS